MLPTLRQHIEDPPQRRRVHITIDANPAPALHAISISPAFLGRRRRGASAPAVGFRSPDWFWRRRNVLAISTATKESSSEAPGTPNNPELGRLAHL
jgi:hypothetical protein